MDLGEKLLHAFSLKPAGPLQCQLIRTLRLRRPGRDRLRATLLTPPPRPTMLKTTYQYEQTAARLVVEGFPSLRRPFQ